MNVKAVEKFLRARLPGNQVALLRFLYNCIKNPWRMRCHLNTCRENIAVLRVSRVNYVPPILGATITDACNLRCPTCLYLLENPDKFFNSFLSADKFRGLLEKYNKGNKAEVIFLTGGEPLMHAQFDQFIEISKEYGLKVKISSNGILIKDKLSSIKKLDSINVSVDSYDYDSFKKYRGGTPNQFDKIRQGLRSMKEQGIAFTMSFLLSRTNLSEADAMVTFAQSIGPNGVNFHNINPHGSGEYASLTIQDESTRQFLDRMTRRTDYPFDIILPVIFDTQSPAFLEGQCVQPWYYFCFNSAGNVAFCCHLEHDAKIGNVFSGYDFNSKDMVRFREDIMAKKVGEKCLYCQRRFLGKDYGRFDSTKKQWQIFSY